MAAAPMMLTPVAGGWSIRLTSGVEIVRFRGILARWRALRYLAALTGS